MTFAVWEWFMGRYEDELGGPYDIRETHPVWKTWWFLVVVVAACIVMTGFFWLA